MKPPNWLTIDRKQFVDAAALLALFFNVGFTEWLDIPRIRAVGAGCVFGYWVGRWAAGWIAAQKPTAESEYKA
jgi:hypothetical protein